MIDRIGYACVNTQLHKSGIRMRTVQKATIDKGGMPVIENLIAENLNNLVKLLEWNVDNGIRLFRVGGDVFPWLGTYSIDSLSNLSDVEYMAGFVGEFAREHDIRLTFHPGPFNVLCFLQRSSCASQSRCSSTER